MFQHIDSDDEEDDYEGYFLRPVNGYKISEKIISANKELFENQDPPSTYLTEKSEKLLQRQQRHVTFRTDLVDFEPDIFTDDYYDDDYVEDDDDPDNDDDEQQYEESDIVPDDVIPLDSDENPVQIHLTNIEKSVISTKMNESINNNDYCDNNSGQKNCVKEIDEICEEIEEVILTKLSSDMDTKNIVIDDDRYSSLTDDSLDVNSVIASPLTTTATTTNTDPIQIATVRQNSSKSRDSSLTKRLSSKINAANTFASNSTSNQCSPSKSPKCNDTESDELLPKIQLNFKPCCEYKYYENDKLPRYSGYLSQYGLSKEQLERRNVHNDRIHQRRCLSSAKKIEEESMKSQVNEQAFARWLRNKMRNSRSLTRNMYDYVPSPTITNKVKNKRKSSAVPQKKNGV